MNAYLFEAVALDVAAGGVEKLLGDPIEVAREITESGFPPFWEKTGPEAIKTLRIIMPVLSNERILTMN